MGNMLQEKDTKWYGSRYGGFYVVPKLLKNEGRALCVGIGEDISFDIQLIGLHQFSVVGIDPTKKAKDYIQKIMPNNYKFIEKALVCESYDFNTIKMYENTNPEWVSESILTTHSSVGSRHYDAKICKLSNFQKEKFDLIKLDIEGAEYSIIDEFVDFSCNHLCIEFHHHCTSYTESDTERCIKKLYDKGFTNILTNNYQEVTFIKN